MIWRFLGSIWLAAILLSSTAVWVIIGTFIESKTGSHLQAGYDHPLFKLMLFGYFVNILVSALRRYPFKKRHIPFLITHLGLLMVIGGTYLKIQYGVQGSMVILEGAGSRKITYPGTRVVEIKERASRKTFYWDPDAPKDIDGISIHQITKAPHGKERWKSWFKGNAVHLSGFEPIPIGPSENKVIALRTDDLEKTIQSYQSKGARLLFLEEPNEDAHLVTISDTGQVERQKFPKDELGTIAVYDEGFSGYAACGYLGDYCIECPLTRVITRENPPEKIEDRREIITLGINGKRVRLVQDPNGAALAVPAVNGNYLLSYRPKTEEIPYHLRLRRARQIYYPGTMQPASFECDLWITEDGKRFEHTLSMNQVWESKSGWRFYLAGMSPQDESAVKRVHLVVNYDPAKYWLTYPGGFLVGFGIIGLFFGRKFMR